MIDKHHSNTHYRIIERKDVSGEYCYNVQAATSRLHAFFGIWKEYAKENPTITEAIKQIESIRSTKLKRSCIVHKE